LALEAETAINKLDITEQQYYRHRVAKTIKRMNQKDNNKNNIRNRLEWKHIIRIKQKISKNELIIAEKILSLLTTHTHPLHS
jgi:hypothetical protein